MLAPFNETVLLVRNPGSDKAKRRWGRHVRRICLSVLGAWLAAGMAHGQQYGVRTYVAPEQLGSAQLRDLSPHPSGRLLVATRTGLRSYDGIDFTDPLPVGEEPKAFVAVTHTRDGTVWALPRWPPFRLFRWHPSDAAGAYLRPEIEVPADAEFVDLAVLGDRLVVATRQHGLWVDDDGWTPTRAPAGATKIRALAAVGQAVAVATGTGLYRFDGARWQGVRELAGTDVLALGLDDASGDLLAIGGGRLWTVASNDTATALASVTLPESAGAELIAAVAGSASTRILFGNQLGLFTFNAPARTVQRLGLADGLAADGVTALHVDALGNFWVGGARGLSRVSFRFQTWNAGNGLVEDEVTAVEPLGPDRLLLGHNSGVTLLDGNALQTIRFPMPLEGNAGRHRIMEIAGAPDGTALLAAVDLGLGRWVDGQVLWEGDANGLAGAVTSIALDQAGTQWAVSDRRLWQRRAGTDDFVAVDLPGPASAIRRVSVGHSGRIFAATAAGLVVIEPDAAPRLVASAERETNLLYAVLEDRNGAVWVGTGGGLMRMAGDRLVPGELGGKTMPRPVYGLMETAAGELWLGTDDGAFVSDGAGLRQLTVRHGLAGYETNRDALVQDTAGRVWIGTSTGLSRYQPRLDSTRDSDAPTIELAAIKIGAAPFAPAALPRLGPEDRDLTVQYRVISLLDEEPVEVETRMVGLDSAWDSASPNRIGEQRFASLPAGTFRFEARARFRNGPWSKPFTSPALRIPAPVWTTTWFRLSGGAAIAGAVALLVVARRLRYRQIYIDRATGLRNRPGFLLLLERRLFRARRSEAPLTVLLIEPDRLDLIAGSLGEGAAEAVLGAVVGRIAPTLGPGEVLGRVGPNQLALATETTGDVAAAQHRAENLLLQLVQPVRVDGHEIFVDASIGLVAGLEGYRSGADMLSDALTARNRARAHGPGTVTSFDPSMRDLARDRLRRQSEFRRALERREIVAAYQPIFDLASGEVVALEALARWQHPTEGLLTPDRFLDVAEDLGLLGALDGQVMEHASSTLQRWRAAKLVGEGPITLHANVSPLELGSAQSRDRIDRASRRLGEHDNLLLEITEHHLLDRSEATFDQMHQLRQLGIAFGIDDFGAGHSSLGYLQDLPVDALKLDRLFVTRLATRGRGIEILSRIIELGRDLGVLVIAEGIETQTQLEELRALGCPAVQGYLLCRPFLEADLIAAGGLAHLVMRPDPSSTETPG